MNNKTLLLTLSFTLGTLFTNAQSLPGFQWGERMGTPDLSWTAQVGAKTYPKGKIFQAADYGLKNDSTRLSTAALQKAIDECHRSGGGTVEVAPGYYRIGAIYLKSNVNLHLNQGTTLIASEDIDLYPEMRSRVAGIEMVWPSAVINILDAETQLSAEQVRWIAVEKYSGINIGPCGRITRNANCGGLWTTTANA